MAAVKMQKEKMILLKFTLNPNSLRDRDKITWE